MIRVDMFNKQVITANLKFKISIIFHINTNTSPSTHPITIVQLNIYITKHNYKLGP